MPRPPLSPVLVDPRPPFGRNLQQKTCNLRGFFSVKDISDTVGAHLVAAFWPLCSEDKRRQGAACLQPLQPLQEGGGLSADTAGREASRAAQGGKRLSCM